MSYDMAAIRFGLLLLLLLLFVQLARPQQPNSTDLMQSRSVDTRVQLEVLEEQPPGLTVGYIPTKPGFTYRFNESPREFRLNGTTGEITTAAVLDREALQSDRFDLVVLSSQPTYPIEVRIQVLDMNDNAPAFPEPIIEVSFSESANAGTRVILDTATDGDVGDNDVTTNYEIVDGNEDDKFVLAVTTNPSGETPYLHLETTGKLDRETKSHYRLNISAQDGGRPRPLYGYLVVNVTIVDVNDNPPIFDHSDYVVSLNESVPPGTQVLQVTATDSDANENARVTYYISETETQFAVDPETGVITTLEPLSCQQPCPELVSCNKSCVFTVLARDHGNPRQDGRTYVTVNLLDANDHDPIIRFRYFPATADYATVDENAQNGSVVAAVSVIDFDEGANGETAVEIHAGNELSHFRLEETPSFHIVRVNGVLDREKISKYNLTIGASDAGSPSRRATAFLIIHVNDVNDHEPIFEKSEYSAVLSESVPIGTYVASITATDQDTGINSNIYYAIVSGNEHQWFELDPITGLLVTRNQLDRELLDSVELRISARDGGPNPRWAYTHIRITLLDENDERPQFVNQVKQVNVSENSAPGTLVASMTALDHDQGTNGSLTYSFTPETDARYPGMFAIDSNSGRISTRTKLDREVTAVYRVAVVARDQGNPSLSSTASLVIGVIDANDNSPEFYPQLYLVSLAESHAIGDAVVSVSASDDDAPENAQVTYTIKSGAEGAFDIDETTGTIRLISKLNGARKPHYKLKIGARDKGNRKAVEDATVEIVVVVVESDTSAIELDNFTFSIVEDPGKREPNIGRELGQIKLKNQKLFEDVKFYITDGDSQRMFQIDENTGVVSTAKRIDRESKPNYELLITARSGFSFGSTKVHVSVEDVNDNAPVFRTSHATTTLKENAPVGCEVYLAKADDPDMNNNSRISYSLSANPFDLFTVSPVSGVVYLNRTMKRDVRSAIGPSVTIEVTATDGGVQPLSSSQLVTVVIEDVNDHTPIFEFASYETSLLETTPVNERFFSLSAVDADAGENGRVRYAITEGNDEAKFGIFPDGMVYVRSQLDRETKDYYALTVVARDGGSPSRSSSVSIVVHVVDENDNAPRFTNETFVFYLPENEPAETYVGRLTASDRDIGRNAELTFSLVTAQQDFALDPKSGFLKTLRYFDREKLLQTSARDTIVLEAMVSDNGVVRLRDRARITVVIVDVNDNAPLFQRTPYRAQVSEGTAIDAPIVRVTATDADDQLNGGVLYFITEGNGDGKFRIDETNGQISLVGELDRETVSNYALQVVARDAGTPSLSSSTIVTIEVLDENDNAPEFMHLGERKLSVSETLAVGSELVTFQASDVDVGANSEIAFAIGSGNVHDTFRVNPRSGALYLEKPLDYEMQRAYQLNVTATDNGNPALVSSVTFIIQVEDANDNAPVFPSTAIVRQIQEGIPLNTPIVTVTAEDPDSGLNSRVRYSLIQQEPSVQRGSVSRGASGPHFAIRPDTGVIYVVRSIDREFADTYRLVVIATDQAEPASLRNSAEKLVTVIVEDVNDNAPAFTSVNAGLLPKGAEIGHQILRVHAVDADANTNGLVTYELVSGERDLFTLDRSSGRLSLRRPLINAESTYKLIVRATDEAVHSQRKSTLTQVSVISTATTGDQAGPQFSKKLYTGSVAENEPAGTSVALVSARYANNPLAEIEYFIYNVTAGGRDVPLAFDVDTKSGAITTSAMLDREAGFEDYELEIIAVTKGIPGALTSTCKVHIKILDRNDCPPLFQEDNMSISVSEDLGIGQYIATLAATDLDTLNKITYTIVSGDSEKKFNLDANKGTLTLRDVIDREIESDYKLTVRADDGEQFTETVLNVRVTDTNDNSPIFTESAYSFDIPEDTGRGAFVGAVSANDIDEGVNAQVSYTVLSDWGNDVFSLNPQSGVFTLTSRLDYEQVQHYIFVVQAQDTGHPSLSSTVTVYFNVLDLNDNTPLFDPMSYNDELYENATVGSSVITVSATDQDSGDNGKLVYSITGGDENQQFGISSNGTVFTRKPLDRETQSLYNLVVTATDQAKKPERRLSSSVLVTITLKDINDMAPEFVTLNESTVTENIPINTVVMAIKAIDKDEGRNSYIEYALAPLADGCFSLGPVDGLLRVSAPLDRESRANYTLHVTAYDRGSPSRSTSMDILVKVLDENDNSPMFEPRQYSASIAENATVGYSVLQVSASDIDEGLNGRIRYTIVGGDINLDFSIGEDTGIVRVAKNLNFERKNQYVLTVQAEDSGNDVRYDTATATITITDINDNAPNFLDSPYMALVMEESASSLPVSIVTVVAHDADSSPFNELRYSIKDGDRSLFRINATTGEIFALRKLDREQQSRYELTVVAVDSGTPVLTGTGSVTIVVQDVNDHAPQFAQTKYVADVLENVPIGTFVVRLTALDADADDNALVRYSLKNVTDVFRIDPTTGLVTTNAQLDREKQSEYQLIAVATDSSQSSPRSTQVPLLITISDVNDNAPVFADTPPIVYVPDSVQAEDFVFGAQAFDADAGLNGKIVYSLNGPDAAKFSINQDSGVVKAATSIRGTSKLEIQASDSGARPQSASVRLEVHQRPAGQFPLIRSESKAFTFSEQTENRAFVTVSAVSNKPAPKSDIRYSVAGGNVGNAFKVNSKSGEVSIGSDLDYELASQYELWIEARDSDSPPLSSVVRYSINVTDFNDNSPVFDQAVYNASTLEEQYPPQMVVKVHATDADSGRNGDITYQLRNHDDLDGAFSLDADSGKIYTNVKLDREESAFYTLVVEAVDHGTPQRTGTATVFVTVADKNDNPPRFTRLFSVNVTENAAIGTFVIQVTSSDRDIGANANATYSFTENPSGKFKIDPLSGNVTVAGTIDRETKEEYLLKVSAVDGSWRAETPLTITVQDQNDNAPVFEHSLYSFSFAELQRSISFVGQVTASDRDKPGPNSMITYSLKQPSEFFSIDSASGEIFSKQMVRYKHSTKSSPENIYSLTVMSTDSGKPPLSSECTVNVNVISASRNVPRFTRAEYFSPIPDSAISGQKIVQVAAQVDEPRYFTAFSEPVEYLLAGGNGSDFFSVNKETGWITVLGSLYGQRDTQFSLVIRAVTKAVPTQFDETSVKLFVTGENRHYPVFTALSYQVIVQESEPLGSIIVSVTASDNDSGPNGQIRYSISSGNEDNKFSIDQSTGAIGVANVLDFDTRPRFTLNITATDLGFEPKMAIASLTILLTDVNDNPPKFNQSSFDGYVSENSPPGTLVIDLEAIDVDSAKNAVIQYSIIGGSGKDLFTIDSETGVITTKTSFDFEEKSFYQLDVLASNPDSPMFGSAVVRIHVTGRNEFFPKFVQPVFHFTISESAPLGSTVGIIQATDQDSGEDGQVYYLLVGSSNDRGFHINPETGVISVVRPLDRESNLHFVSVFKEQPRRADHETFANRSQELRDYYAGQTSVAGDYFSSSPVDHARIVLTVMAKNKGGIRGNDTDEAQIIISIQDGNDPPVFVQHVFNADQIRESAPIGTKVVTVLAVDKDVRAPNNEFSYTILGGEGSKAFKIDPNTGVVETVTLLDRETQAFYNITVGAIDAGSPPQTGTAEIHISVQDVNDNFPVFEPANPVGSVYENEPPGTSVMTLAAVDADLPPNTEPFSYAIVGGEHKNLFVVDQETGIVRTAQTIDREQAARMSVIVEIWDNGSPRLKSQWPVAINVLDRNDNPSTSRTVRVLVNTFAGSFKGGAIADVRPNDVDLSGQYSCRVVDSPKTFTIQNDCQLYVRPNFTDSSFQVSGNDGVHSDVTSSVSVSFTTFTNSTLANSVTLRVLNVSAERLLQTYWKSFTDILQSQLRQPQIFSIHPEDDHVDVTLSVRKGQDYLDRKGVINTLENARESLQVALSTKIVVDYSPCRDNPCQNGGQCSSSLERGDSLETVDSPSIIFTGSILRHQFTCTCTQGFSGETCAVPTDPCLPSPCKNGGACSRQGSDFHCTCPSGFLGKRCDQERNRVCETVPCKNGGTCQETPEGAYFCLCRPGYRGSQCELTSDSCRPNPCLNGGVCENRKPGYRCRCSDNFFGVHCEKSSFGFSELSYMAFSPLEASTNDISIVFSTIMANSLLVYNYGQQIGGRSDFVALEIFNGRVRFVFGGSQTAIASINVHKPVADGKWYRVTATRNGRVASLSVAECSLTGESCRDCRPGDRTCSADYIGLTGTLNFSNQLMYLGGIPSIEAIRDRPGQVHSDDFVGCVHSVSINGRSLNLSQPVQSRGITNTCHRRRDVCDSHRAQCGERGLCIDNWSKASCFCQGGIMASNCFSALEPVSLVDGGFVEFRVSERHQRQQIMRALYYEQQRSSASIKREVSAISHHYNSISVAFRTLKKDGVLLFASTNNDFTALSLRDGLLHYTSKYGLGEIVNMTIENVNVADGSWHNVTLLSKLRTLALFLDGQQLGDELETSIVHDFMDPYLTSLFLGASTPEARNLHDFSTGFEGCLTNLTVNGELQPLNSSGTLFDQVIQHGRTLAGCSGSITGASTAPDPLSIGITLVIVFFVILLVAILVSFVVVRIRRQQRDKKTGHQINKHVMGPSTDPARGGHLADQNYVETSDVNEDLRSRLEITSKKFREHEIGDVHRERDRPQRPDIIEREVVNKSPGVPLRPDDIHMNERSSMNLLDCEPPEHYDLENASSIAPSDIDIVYHYKGYRDGNVRKYKTNPHVSSYHKHTHRHSPHGFVSQHRESPRNLLRSSPAPASVAPARESPGVLKMQSTPLARLSPSSELSQQTPRILTLQDLSGKPLQTALLATSQVGKDVMSASERSLNSPVSHLSQSTSSMRNSQANKKKKKQNDLSLGLTAEDIERLSGRPRNSSLVSTLDAVSSSSDDERPRSKEKLAELMETNTELLETAESSTDESGNDSFTCSEFEYENSYEKVTRDFGPGNMIFSKLAEVDNENEHDNESSKHYDGFDSFRGSLSTLVASDDDLSNISAYKPPNGSSLGWDYLLNWGPNFESLVGVFKDIAELPDTSRVGVGSRMISEPGEEYI